MNLLLQINSCPSDQAAKLKATMERFNEAADWLAGELFARKCRTSWSSRELFYAELRERFGLSSQMAIRCIARVCEAYKRDQSMRPKFRPHAAMPFDQRMMSFKGADRVSLLTLNGRVLVAFVMGKYQAEKFTNAKGQADLVFRDDGKWFLLVTVDVPAGTKTPATEFGGGSWGRQHRRGRRWREAHLGEDRGQAGPVRHSTAAIRQGHQGSQTEQAAALPQGDVAVEEEGSEV